MSDKATIQSIARLVPAGSRVLDLGCGDGALLDHLQRHR
ncbi:MAG TPA: methionine biosynthesis protein MetW, partial [Ramlibacter sp.]|nr:methionine biosynthesis protein MetW [Ramlibacter sp.]